MVGSNDIERTSSIKFLGVMLDDLDWSFKNRWKQNSKKNWFTLSRKTFSQWRFS